MNTDSRLHHYCQNVTIGHLKDVVEMYGLLGMEVTYTPPPTKIPWIMMSQSPLKFAIQISETSDNPIENIEIKNQAHIAFISENPKEIIEKVKTWAEGKSFKFRQGGWSEREFYFDLPDIFVNFTVEVMHTSIEEK